MPPSSLPPPSAGGPLNRLHVLPFRGLHGPIGQAAAAEPAAASAGGAAGGGSGRRSQRLRAALCSGWLPLLSLKLAPCFARFIYTCPYCCHSLPRPIQHGNVLAAPLSTALSFQLTNDIDAIRFSCCMSCTASLAPLRTRAALLSSPTADAPPSSAAAGCLCWLFLPLVCASLRQSLLLS